MAVLTVVARAASAVLLTTQYPRWKSGLTLEDDPAAALLASLSLLVPLFLASSLITARKWSPSTSVSETAHGLLGPHTPCLCRTPAGLTGLAVQPARPCAPPLPLTHHHCCMRGSLVSW
jgi:hypothetical protein